MSTSQGSNSTIRSAITSHWHICIYLILITAGLSFLAHSSQDLYPIFLTDQRYFSETFVSVTLTVAYTCAFISGIICGHFSTFFGRRLTMIVVLVVGAAVIPAYVLPKDASIIIGASLQQICVQGACGILPVHLLELAPTQFRSFVIGSVYEVGNFVTALAPTIVAGLAEHFPLTESGTSSHANCYDYGKSIAISIGCVYACMIPILLLSPEKRNIDELRGDSCDENGDDETSSTLERIHLLPKIE